MNFVAPMLKKLGSVRGIAAGALATAELPAKGTHYGLFLYARTAGAVPLTRAQIIADVGDVIVRVEGEQKFELSSKQILDLQKYYGDSDNAGNIDGVVPIWFYPRGLATWQEKMVYGYGMADVKSFTVDTKITGVAQLSTLDVWTYSTDENRVLGPHLTIRRFPQNFPTTGLQEISSLLKGGSDTAYKALHIELNTGTIDYVTCKVDGTLIHDQVPPNLNQIMNEETGRKFQAGYYSLAFDKINDLKGLLPMADVADFRQQINWITAAPGNFSIIAEIVKAGK